MADKSLVLFVVLLATTFGQDVPVLRLNNNTVPLHYEVALTIDVDTKSFLVQESILITVLEDTSDIKINVNGLVSSTSWLASTRLISDDGVEFRPIDAIEDIDNQILALSFADLVTGNANYTLQFTDVQGSFGNGLLEVPLSTDDSSEL